MSIPFSRLSLVARTSALGIPIRTYGGRLTLLLPAKTTLPDLILQLEGVPVRSVALRPVGLHQVFLELTQSDKVREGEDGKGWEARV